MTQILSATAGAAEKRHPPTSTTAAQDRKAAKHPWGIRTAAGILGTKEGVQIFEDWLQKSHFYEKICKHH